jgi:polyisoprenoid-binding protein YceI
MRIILSFIPLALGAALLAPAATSLEFDPGQTKVEFTLGATLHTVHGSFQFKRGDLRFDPATGQAEGELVVDTASGATGSDSRDANMHKNILESSRYPEIVFRPDRVEGKVAAEGASKVQLHGTFRMQGADHEMTVPVEVEAAGGKYTATARFQVPYVKWGMKNASTFILRVSDTVDLTVRTVLTIPAPGSPAKPAGQT